jgi:hypothetical protein
MLYTSSDGGLYNKRIWKGKVPAKIKIFMWLMTKDAILTKDNLIKRKWKGDPVCYFCKNLENISHLFFQCCVVKAVWAVIAKVLVQRYYEKFGPMLELV